MSREQKKIKSSVVVVEKEHKFIPPDEVKRSKEKNKVDYEFEEGEIIEKAVTEIERDAKITRIRGEASGTWHCPLRKTNKTFLTRALVQTINHNNREVERHKDRSNKKLEQLTKHRDRHPIEKYENGRHFVRNPFVRPMTREMGYRFVDIEFERRRNAQKRAERQPPRGAPGIKFVKPRDLDERVLIPGQPKLAKVKKISFVTPNHFEDKYLGHDGRDLHMERIRQKIGMDKIPIKTFVLPENEEDKVFILSGNKVAGLIRAVESS